MTRLPRRLGVALVILCLVAAGCATPVHRHRRGWRPARGPASGPASASASAGTRLVAIPATRSGFHARRALIWVPPAARRSGEHARLPVLMLLGGNPSAPLQWLTRWHLPALAAAFAARHGGRAPMVVMPDENGSLTGDTECVDSTRGNAEQYLVEDVPAYVLTHYPAAHSASQWGIGGVSEGGMCSALLALRHPDRFSAFADLSGLTRPTLGEHDSPERTLTTLFGGSMTAFEQHEPLWLLAHRRYPSLAAWLGCGAGDAQDIVALHQLAAAAGSASVAVTTDVAPGGHDLTVWRGMLASVFAWFWRHAAG